MLLVVRKNESGQFLCFLKRSSKVEHLE